MARKQEYGNESITSLKGADRVRKRPAVIFGSDGVEGCAHSIFEIVSNSIDEARDGHGDTINVTRCKDGSVIVEDFGRGMPVDWNNGEGRYNWELLFCEMYAGGKYGEGEDNYEFSLGLNGLGLCATQYASAWMTADIYRDGFHYHLDFKKGENVGGLQKEPYKGRRTGSIIHWKPDDEVFTDIDVPGSYYKDVLRRQAVVNAGLTLNFTDEKEKDPATGKPWKESWCYQNGIADYVQEVAGEDTLTPVFSCESEASGRDREDQPDYKVRMSAAFCFSNKVQLLEYYHNSSWLEHGGSPEHAVRTAFVYQINKYLKDKNLYKKGESAISFQDVQDCLVYVSSSFSTRTSYENQTKKAITNKFVSQAMTDFLKHYLEVYFLEKPEEAQKICQQVLVNKQSREHAEKTRQSIKKTLSTQIDLANRVQKFVDCRTKDASRRELYIVEGDSAMGAVKQSRDSEYQAIMPIRGKILNCLKADYARIFKSDVIVDLIKVMGCGVELGGKHNKELATFNIDNLRYNKIVICTDADVDGYQIRTLVLTMLYRLTPTLINEGYVYIAESPLYEITTKDHTYFAYTEPEKAAFLKEIGDKKYTIQRSKGLGENDPEMMWLTTMNPESRRLIKVLPTDVEETARVFDLLLGDNLAGRKEHIAQHGAEYLDDLLGKGEKEKAEKIFTEYLENVQKLHSKKPFTITEEFKNVFGDVPMPGGLTCTDVTNIDMICDNVVMTRPYTLLDYEWTFEFPVPCEFVLYRIIHYYIQTHKVREVLNAAGLYEKFGISEVMRTSFSRMESGFQVYITGTHVPMREMYATMTPGVEYLSLSNLGPLQVYFAEQRGMYSEASSVKRPIMAGKVKCTLNLPKSCRFIRIDPGDHPCTVHLAAIRFDRMPASLDGVLTPDGTICGSWAFLSRFDPCIVDIEVPEGAKNLTLNLEIDEAKEDMLNRDSVPLR